MVDDETLPASLNIPTSVDAHTRLTHSRGGQLTIFTLTVLMSLWIVLPNLPASPFRNTIDVLWTPAIELGLNQSWYVFSPDPRAESFEFGARIEYADGSVETWEPPDFGSGLGAYRGFRWRKWADRVRIDSNEAHWEPTANWLAREHGRAGELPIRITLFQRSQEHFPLGADPFNGEWIQSDIYTWERDG